jgi:hypothetical protein
MITGVRKQKNCICKCGNKFIMMELHSENPVLLVTACYGNDRLEQHFKQTRPVTSSIYGTVDIIKLNYCIGEYEIKFIRQGNSLVVERYFSTLQVLFARTYTYLTIN